MGKWTLPQAGQAQFAGITQEGINRFDTLRGLVRQGRNAQGLAVEKAFLRKIRADKGILADTYEEERARKRRRNTRPVAVAPPMEVADVEATFDE